MGLMLFNCQLNTQESKLQSDDIAAPSFHSVPLDSLSTEFRHFYTLFHQDSLFQIEHIVFPLDGKPSRADLDMDLVDFKWTRSGWKLHQPFDEMDDTFMRSFLQIDEHLLIERIYSPDYGYYLERRWAYMRDDWHLIYYADIQEPSEE